MSLSLFDPRSPRKPSLHQQTEHTAGDVLSISLFTAYHAGKKVLSVARVTTETIVDAIIEGNDAAHERAGERGQILEAFAALPIDQQEAYLSLQAEDRRQQLQAMSPLRALRGLFSLGSELEQPTSPAVATSQDPTRTV